MKTNRLCQISRFDHFAEIIPGIDAKSPIPERKNPPGNPGGFSINK